MCDALTTRACPQSSPNHNGIAAFATALAALVSGTVAATLSMEPAAAVSLVALTSLGTLMIGGHVSSLLTLARDR